jgi:hypothetical protein
MAAALLSPCLTPEIGIMLVSIFAEWDFRW